MTARTRHVPPKIPYFFYSQLLPSTRGIVLPSAVLVIGMDSMVNSMPVDSLHTNGLTIMAGVFVSVAVG